MAKHVAPPATAEQIRQTLGITQEDMKIVERLLRDHESSREIAPRVEPPSGNTSKRE